MDAFRRYTGKKPSSTQTGAAALPSEPSPPSSARLNQRDDVPDTLAASRGSTAEEAQQASLRKAMRELKKPTPSPASTKGALRNAASAIRTRKTPTSVLSLRESEVLARENYQRILSAGVQRGHGITAIEVAGTILLQEQEASLLREAMNASTSTEFASRPGPREKRGQLVLDLASIDVAILKKMATDLRFPMFVLRLSVPGTCFVHIENEDGCQINSTATEKQRGQVNLRDEEGKKTRRKLQHLARVSGATAMALRCLRDQQYSLFAQIAAIAPEIILDEICTIPFTGNVFTPEALVSVLKALTPPTDEVGNLGDDVPESTQAISHCINHFFRYSSVKDLQESIKKPLQYVREGAGTSDLLIQNQYRFLHEVVNLRKLLLDVEISSSAPEDRLAAVRKSAWQSAEFIGNTFKYMQATAKQFGKDRRDLASHIDSTVVVLKTMAGVGLGNLPVPGGVAGMADLSVDTIGELLSQWALKTGTDFNITELATKLAIVSDNLKERSIRGSLVPGRKELTQSGIDFGGSDEADWNERLEEGRKFHQTYDAHLRKFKEHYLERTTKEDAKPLQ